MMIESARRFGQLAQEGDLPAANNDFNVVSLCCRGVPGGLFTLGRGAPGPSSQSRGCTARLSWRAVMARRGSCARFEPASG